MMSQHNEMDHDDTSILISEKIKEYCAQQPYQGTSNSSPYLAVLLIVLLQVISSIKECVDVTHGIWALGLPSVRLMMTRPRAESDLLMFLASSSTVPSAPVLDTFSDPARSTRYLMHNEQSTRGSSNQHECAERTRHVQKKTPI